jgi:hypothetical protein
MSNINGKNEVVADVATATITGPLVITWTSNEPTAGVAQTIANGTIPTVAELGQYAANSVAIINQLVVDVGLLQTAQQNG